jgi:hypothetical protein
MTGKSRDQHPTSSITDVLADLRATSRWQKHVHKQLHAHPELSFQEIKTAASAALKLKELGYEVLEGICRTGVVGVLRNGESSSRATRVWNSPRPARCCQPTGSLSKLA